MGNRRLEVAGVEACIALLERRQKLYEGKRDKAHDFNDYREAYYYSVCANAIEEDILFIRRYLKDEHHPAYIGDTVFNRNDKEEDQ